MTSEPNTLEIDLRALPLPAPPRDMAAVILARIARVEQPAPEATPARDWPAWVMTLGGIAASLAIVTSLPIADWTALDMFAGARLSAAFAPAPGTATGAMLLVAGLLLYLTGLFAPLRARSSTRY